MKSIKEILINALSHNDSPFWLSRNVEDIWVNPNFEDAQEGDVCWFSLPKKCKSLEDLSNDEALQLGEIVEEAQNQLTQLGLHLYSSDLREEKIPRISKQGTSFSMLVLPNQVQE